MHTMRRHRPCLVIFPAVALLALITGGVQAADVPPHRAVVPFAAERRDALDRLEQAEVAVLNRHVYDLSPQLRTDRPVPATSAISDLDAARLAVLTSDARHARQAISAANHLIGAEFGTATRTARHGGSLAQAGKEKRP